MFRIPFALSLMSFALFASGCETKKTEDCSILCSTVFDECSAECDSDDEDCTVSCETDNQLCIGGCDEGENE